MTWSSKQIQTSLGLLTLVADDRAIVALFPSARAPARFAGARPASRHSVLQAAARELAEYFAGRRREFDVPVAGEGTEFQRKVWDALRRIPFGRTRSYSELAAEIGAPAACRAVGAANGRNPVPILVPCHRVIGKDGSLTGFALGLEFKRALLEIER
jgi:methylated-DNA-[protein]-cysteine S-methyltransferase